MTCDDAVTLIHLNRPGERTEHEDHLLAAHLRTCEPCSREAAIVRNTAMQMEALVRAAVPPVHVAAETGRILGAIREESRPPRDVLDMLLHLASRRMIRLAYGALSIVGLAIMAMQVSSPRPGSVPGEPRTGPYIAYAVASEPLSKLADLPLPEPLRSSVLTQPMIEIRKDEVERSSRLIGQAMLHSFSLTAEQRRYAEAILTSLGEASELSIRIGKIGG